MLRICFLAVLGSGVALLAGCSAITSTTDTAADALHTVSHGISVSSRSTSDATSGDPKSAQNARTRAYVHSQMGQLRREAATGGGEHIDALARLMNSPRPNRLGPWMQAHYQSLFERPQTETQFIQVIRARRS